VIGEKKVRIKILPPKIINLIAAGEVVDRPSSVVKELIENSIDAGARHISVEVKGDGRELIRVIDDGIGMTEDDALLAFERHATSKISQPGDLDRITTMGFRGEALPSIAGVSEIELVTRTEADDLATKLTLRAGKLEDTGKTSGSVGTAIKVMNLFYNTPARAKFLKSKPTEIRHTTRTFATHALSQYGISMKLIRDRKVILSLPAVDSIEERIGGILGRNFGENSVPVNVSDEYVQLCGFLSRPEEARSSTGHTSIFVNGRPVESRPILSAICGAYGNTLKRGRYPTGVILISIDPSEVDFNIHPTKKQVRFRREKEVRDFVFRAVQSALTSRKMIPPLIVRPRAGAGVTVRTRHIPLLSKQDILVSEPKRAAYRMPKTDTETGVIPIVQIKNSYILAESDAEFYLIDQHAAHERVLYEEARTNLEGQEPVAQKLLFPETVEVTPEEEDLIDEHLDDFRKIGFDVRKFGRRTYVVEAVPALLKEATRKTILTDMVDEVILTRSESPDTHHLLAAAFACKAAIKAGDRLTDEETKSLTDRLFNSRMPFACPHGRPTMIRLSWEEIERRFLRR
jgi:DNA mismatch repair protein MutL